MDKPLLKNNYPVARENINERYQGLVLRDIDNSNKVLHTVSSRHTEYEKGEKGSWSVLEKPFDYDGIDLDCLEQFQINKDTLIQPKKKTDQPNANNVHMIYRNGNNNTSESKKDVQDGSVTAKGGQD